MPNPLLALAQTRKSTKAFDPSRKIPAPVWEQIVQYLLLSPSSTNLQPWKFLCATRDQAKAKLLPALQGPYSANAAKIADCSHVLVFCAQTLISDDRALSVAQSECAQGRMAQSDIESMHQRRLFFVDLHRGPQGDVGHWCAKQAYLALGHLLIGVESWGVQACPIEGFDLKILDQVLDLPAQGLQSVALVALGYRSEQDWNAGLPKSRLDRTEVYEEL